MAKFLAKPGKWFLFLLALGPARVNTADLTLTVDVPKTAYIQWLTNSTDNMTSVDGNLTDPFPSYTGGAMTQLTQPAAQALYIGIMCNSLAGYELNLTGANSPTATTAQMTQAGAANVTYTCALTKVAGTFTGGTVASTTLDLTGGTVSGSTTHTAEADLPLTDTAPNVWDLGFTLPAITTVSDGLIMSGTYTGSVTATVTLK